MYSRAVPKSLSSDQTYGWPPPPVAALPDTPTAATGAGAKSTGADTDLNFGDLLDIANPLQHIPVVSSLYRAITGDQIATGARIIGDTIFGGIYGFASALVNTVTQAVSGADIGGHIVALFSGDDTAPTPATASTPAVAAAPPWVDPDTAATRTAANQPAAAQPVTPPVAQLTAQPAAAPAPASSSLPPTPPAATATAPATPAAIPVAVGRGRFIPIGNSRSSNFFQTAAVALPSKQAESKTARMPQAPPAAAAASSAAWLAATPKPKDPADPAPAAVPATATAAPTPTSASTPPPTATTAPPDAGPPAAAAANPDQATASYAKAMELARQLQQFYQPQTPQ